MKSILIILSFLLFKTVLLGKNILIPTEYSTIQAGINAASDGDTVLISDQVYSGEGNFSLHWDASVKHLTIKSVNGAENCIIDCLYEGRGFILDSAQNNKDRIEGLTIKNGWVKTIEPINTGGGAILCDNTSPQIINCKLIHNIAGDSLCSVYISYYADGGAIDCISMSYPTIKNNLIQNNFANHTGGGIHFGDESFGLVENNIIDNNKSFGCYGGGGIALVYSSHPTIVGNQITNNNAKYYLTGGYGGGIVCVNSDPLIVNNTIVNNSTLNGEDLGEGGGIRIRGLPSPIIKNCIIWNNEAKDSLENLDFQYPDWTLDISYSDIGGGVYDINVTSPSTLLDLNPNFLDLNNDNYQLRSNSPCIDMGSPDTTGLHLPEYDLAGNPRIINGRIDIGAFEYNPASVIIKRSTRNLTFTLHQNYPNPFNPTTTISYTLPKSAKVIVDVFNSLGQKVKTLIDKQMPSGLHRVKFDAGNLPSGIYFFRLQAGEFQSVKKMLLIR